MILSLGVFGAYFYMKVLFRHLHWINFLRLDSFSLHVFSGRCKGRPTWMGSSGCTDGLRGMFLSRLRSNSVAHDGRSFSRKARKLCPLNTNMNEWICIYDNDFYPLRILIRIRGAAASLATAFNWACTFLVTKTFMDLQVRFHSYPYLEGWIQVGVFMWKYGFYISFKPRKILWIFNFWWIS